MAGAEPLASSVIWMCFCSAFGVCPKASQATIWQLSLAFLSRKQVHAQRLLEPLLESNRYRDLLASWRSFLQDATTGVPNRRMQRVRCRCNLAAYLASL